ncbi:HNH endonuclease [Solilutibacter oculi]|nr:HNH endonuclease [Lysobacter oculi]
MLESKPRHFHLVGTTPMASTLVGIPRLMHHTFPPYGSCIYCGRTDDLRTEHIVPYGLEGNLKLPRSTCGECADRTSRIERAVLRGDFRVVRVYRGLQSRRKHAGAPELYALNITRDGQEQQVEVPLDEYPVVLHFPIYPPPRILTTSEKRPGVDIRGVDTISFGPNPLEVMKKLGAQSIGATLSQRPAEFARMIAKIAYAMAAATGTLKLLAESSELPAMILGEDDAIGHFVGTIEEPNASHPEIHRVLLIEDRGRGLLIGDVQIFSDSHTPRYGVVIGKLA